MANDQDCDEENTKVVISLRSKQKTFYSRAARRLVHGILHRVGIKKPHKARYVMSNLLGDASAFNDQNQVAILEGFNQYVSLGEDIVVDLRENNGQIPKFDAFWDVVAKYIEDKTAIDDRRHSNETNGEIITSMAIATGYADMYRQCVKIAAAKDEHIEVPPKRCFLLQFWPSNRTISNVTRYTGRFKVKRMVQARLLCKNNTDSHYANAIYSFLKERAVLNITSNAMFSADAKCKVTVGEHDYPIAAVSRGKAVIVGKNEVFKVGDHNFSRVSLIPDATLIHTIPEQNEDDENTEYNKKSVGKWYTGKVFYSIKDMPTQGSSAMRGVAELSAALTSHYELEECPSSMYLYTDGGVIGKIPTSRSKKV